MEHSQTPDDVRACLCLHATARSHTCHSGWTTRSVIWAVKAPSEIALQVARRPPCMLACDTSCSRCMITGRKNCHVITKVT